MLEALQMSRHIAERAARLVAMFPDLIALEQRGMQPSADALATFRRYDLSREARLVATYAASESEHAAGCYAAIQRSLIPR